MEIFLRILWYSERWRDISKGFIYVFNSWKSYGNEVVGGNRWIWKGLFNIWGESY